MFPLNISIVRVNERDLKGISAGHKGTLVGRIAVTTLTFHTRGTQMSKNRVFVKRLLFKSCCV